MACVMQGRIPFSVEVSVKSDRRLTEERWAGGGAVEGTQFALAPGTLCLAPRCVVVYGRYYVSFIHE